jgi:hypothetical protein
MKAELETLPEGQEGLGKVTFPPLPRPIGREGGKVSVDELKMIIAVKLQVTLAAFQSQTRKSPRPRRPRAPDDSG